MGDKGDKGDTGTDGLLRIWGDGSAGAYTVTGNEDWLSTPQTNLQFTDFSVPAGTNLLLPSGTIIRATGTITIAGNVSGAEGALGQDNVYSGVAPITPPLAGVSTMPASAGPSGPNTTPTPNGAGGRGLRELQARQILHPGVLAGGAGGASLDSRGSDGGAAVTFLAKGAITIAATGSIGVDGQGVMGGGAGGGGGGIVILASKTSVTNNGLISAKGGSVMGGGSPMSGAGGGGGGGIIHLLAPVVTLGTTNVGGGTGGTNGLTVNASPRSGGGGGGACGGFGGAGGGINGANMSGNGGDGTAGFAVTTVADPSALL